MKYTIFCYSLLHLSTTDKVRFYYALKGRDGKTGVVKQYTIEQLGRTVLFVQEKHSKAVQEFLEYWKCNFTKKEVELLG
jgi:hypothetical protein